MRPFLYPPSEWAYRKIERAITAMGEDGTKTVSVAEEGETDE